MSTTTTTTTTRDRGDRYGPTEWVQLLIVAAFRKSRDRNRKQSVPKAAICPYLPYQATIWRASVALRMRPCVGGWVTDKSTQRCVEGGNNQLIASTGTYTGVVWCQPVRCNEYLMQVACSMALIVCHIFAKCAKRFSATWCYTIACHACATSIMSVCLSVLSVCNVGIDCDSTVQKNYLHAEADPDHSIL